MIVSPRDSNKTIPIDPNDGADIDPPDCGPLNVQELNLASVAAGTHHIEENN